jgi:hypothetical protein
MWAFVDMAQDDASVWVVGTVQGPVRADGFALGGQTKKAIEAAIPDGFWVMTESRKTPTMKGHYTCQILAYPPPQV